MKNKLIALILVLIVTIFIIPSIVIVNAATTSHANQANSSSGNSLSDRLKVESTITTHGKPMKVTLYLCKTSTVNRDASGKVLAPKDVGINEFAKFGKSIIVGTEADVGFPRAYVNIDTCKLDQLSKQVAPAYSSSSINSIGGVITSLSIPAWGDSSCNADNETAIKKFFTCAGDEKLTNLDALIRKVAEKTSGKTGMDAVNSTLSKINQTDFDYVDSNEKKVTLQVANILPMMSDKTFLANWLVVVEPMFTYQQDPYGYFGTNTKVAAMTATDAVLANKAAEQTGAAFKYKFYSGSPGYNAIVRYCDRCDVTWFAYSKGGTPNIATFCPLPCPSVGPYAEKSGVRYPFAINTAVRNTAKAWQLSETWLDGYAKAGSLNSTPNEEEILTYGGYALYFLGPKMQQSKPTPEPISTPTPIPTPTSSKNVLYENELTKAISPGTDSLISKVFVEKTSTDTTCDGEVNVPCTHTNPLDSTKKLHSYDEKNCGHSNTLSNAYNVIPKTLNVQTAWYWTQSMFNDVSRLSALRPNGALVDNGKTFVFNITNSFTSNDMRDAFDPITEYRFITHRSADPDNNGAVRPLQLAAYMNGTTLNSNYLSFINPYYGGAYPSTYSKPNGYFGDNSFDLHTAVDLPQNAKAVGTGDFCSGGSSSSLNIPTKLSGEIVSGASTEKSTQFKTYTPITIQRTIASDDKAASLFKTSSLYWGIDPSGAINPSYHIQIQSDTIRFNPAFKMQYQDSNNQSSPFKDVWVLAAGEKTFISNDYVKIEVTGTNLIVTSPWSRDSEDKVDERGNARTIPTAKSGSAIKASANGTTIQVDVYYNVQDPNFVDPSQRVAAQTRNDAKARQFDNMVTSIADAFENDGVSFYSNMFQSTTANTLNKVTAPNFFKDLTEKTALKLTGSVTASVNSQTRAYYVDVNGIADYTTPERTIALNGQNIPANNRWSDISAVRSENVLNGILEKNGGITVSGWYNEDYEGILVIKKTYIITLDGAETTYAQIHPQHSDSQTARNELAQQLKFVQGSEILIPSNQYGIGVEYRLPTLNVNGQTFSNIVIPSKPFIFSIRGAVYDTK